MKQQSSALEEVLPLSATLHLAYSVTLVGQPASPSLSIYIHIFSKCLLSIYYVPGIVLSAGNTAQNKIDKNENLALMELTFWWR